MATSGAGGGSSSSAALAGGSALAPPPLSVAERALVLSALLNSDPPHRAHGRGPLEFRPIAVQTGVLPAAHGSARLTLGVGAGGGGFDTEAVTEVLVGVSVEVKKVDAGEAPVMCAVEVDPALQHSLPAPYSTETLSASLTNLLAATLSHAASSGSSSADNDDSDAPPELFPLSQRAVIPGQSHWHFYIDATILSLSAGNLVDATFAAVFAALADVRIPRTRPVRFRTEEAALSAAGGGKQKGDELGLIKQTRQDRAVDFELLQDDTGLGGDPLLNWAANPVCVTVSLLPKGVLLDADATESNVVPSQIHIIASASGHIYGIHFAGPGGFWEASAAASAEAPAEGDAKPSLPPGAWNPNESIQRGMGSRYDAVKNAIKVGVNSASSLASLLCAQIEQQQQLRAR
ncbi:hypothetical protein OC844_000953 [Tilletia horrida]|nr:hypothetical protein OC844_000953 [Tilletia horrida]